MSRESSASSPVSRREFLRAAGALTGATGVGAALPGNLGVHTIEQFRQNLEIVHRFQTLATEHQERLASAGRELAKEWGPHFGPAV